jgi:cob(I)alamin adenosyltransferase
MHLREKLGLVHVITGEGRGKTTSALGLAVRASGRGLKCYIIQFLKGIEYGECLALKKLPNIEVKQFGRPEFISKERPLQIDFELARAGLEYAKRIIQSNEYNLVILDEINVAISYKLIPLEEVIELVKNKPPNVELVLTGRYAPMELVELADYATEMKEVKHPYRRGVLAREGIEY